MIHRLVVLLYLLMPVSSANAQSPSDLFEKKIRPLFLDKCVRCHGAEKPKGELRLDSAEGFAKGGKSGAVTVAGKPDESLLIQAVRQTGEVKMPPKGRLTDQEIADLAAWVKGGAVWPKTLSTTPVDAAKFTEAQKAFWAFQPFRSVSIPILKAQDSAFTNPVDRFVVAKLSDNGLSLSPPIDKRTLIRRVTFDLTGLPPTPEEINDFIKDDSPAAFEKVVDRLLASPHYGERWARHWLDVVRFAESTANDANAVMRYAWRYRDYVVQSFNSDKPYDQFVIEQLAGDLLPSSGECSRDASRIIATGFLMVGPKALAEPDKEQSRIDIVDDQLDVTGRAFLGLTLGCARCHDHKFDPIPTADYYSLAGIFRSTEVFRDENRNASMWQEWAVPESFWKWVVVMAPKEGKPADLRIHIRGNRLTLGAIAPRRFLQIIAGEGHAPIQTKQSGRLELAKWIASADNPLTSRVMVNRIWHHHFGTGLVSTPDNFGARGDRPSHPELLDWLAAEFVKSGWSVKHIHKLILLSATYQQGNRSDRQAARVDPNNRLLWQYPRRRLDAESLRDAMLAVSGKLDRTVGGDDSGELLFKEGEVIDKNRPFFRPNQLRGDNAIYTTSTRRSIYLPVVRNAIPDIFALFDGADPNGVTANRNDTTVASQALFLLNNPFVRDQAQHLAKRLLADSKATTAERLALGFRLALGRDIQTEELKDIVAFLGRYEKLAVEKRRTPAEARLAAWQSFCQTLLCRNEFLYVE
jgi:cytochrome c553